MAQFTANILNFYKKKETTKMPISGGMVKLRLGNSVSVIIKNHIL